MMSNIDERNQCWNCNQFCEIEKAKEFHSEGGKDYYTCNHCGKWMHT